ncbi:peroxisomal biogenesis factor 19 [Condylostylus longicornis]|uniref:peroxisomal biogenesis factor 19 n=1 Tax=Condylostylus longicornis TaxID=2530218 RepID=UPI00244DF9A6|nr:peroxisomal biogenesis factor 19 [Condylostylus longicornis]
MSDNKKSIKSEDDGLDDLLDSALEDFQKYEGDSGKQDGTAGEKSNEAGGTTQELLDEDFFIQQANLLSEKMNSIFNAAGESDMSNEHINYGFQKLAEAAALALQGDVPVNESGTRYADSISEALKGLKEGAENLQAPVSEEEITSMFSNIGLGNDSVTDDNPFLPFMQGMMQSLLSAEILLPSIEEILQKYPKYLEENGDKIKPDDKTRYENQLELFKVLAEELRLEKADDSAEVKQNRFKKILDNMHKLQEYGQPPEELIAEVGGAGGLPNFDAITSGSVPGNNQCPMM